MKGHLFVADQSGRQKEATVRVTVHSVVHGVSECASNVRAADLVQPVQQEERLAAARILPKHVQRGRASQQRAVSKPLEQRVPGQLSVQAQVAQNDGDREQPPEVLHQGHVVVRARGLWGSCLAMASSTLR